jgi:hypothetical protein
VSKGLDPVFAQHTAQTATLASAVRSGWKFVARYPHITVCIVDLWRIAMNTGEQCAILTLCLMAAFADGGNSERERAEIKRIADTLGDAKELQGKYMGQIAEQARTLDVNKLLSVVRQR